MFIADLRLISPEFSTWFLKRDWIVILLGRREKFVTTLRPDLFRKHRFGSVS